MDRTQDTEATTVRLPRTAAPTLFVASSDGSVSVIDTIAVERAVKGDRSGWTLTPDEIHYAASFMVGRVAWRVIGERLGACPRTIRRSLDQHGRDRSGHQTKLPAPCGTRSAYRAHKRRGEATCSLCRAANSAADRYYRIHGTYVGAPQAVAA